MEREFQRSSGTQTIDRAAQLLALVLDAEGPRPLAALERQGLVHQQGERGDFSPGPVMVRFARRGADRHLAELARPHLDALSDASGETINLAVPTATGVE